MTSSTDDGLPINPLLMTPDGHWHAELQAKVEAAIRRYPDMDAEWWIGGSAALSAVDEWLREQP